MTDVDIIAQMMTLKHAASNGIKKNQVMDFNIFVFE